jgi:uncharacterized membrane protein
MEIFSKGLLVLHIISGFASLVFGLIPIVSKKGSNIHKKAGRVFFYSMLGVCFTSVVISLMKDNRFLLQIGIFAFYMNYAGWRAVKHKSLVPNTADWIIIVMGSLNSILMIGSLNLILMVFGGIGIFAATGHWKAFIKLTRKIELPPLSWLKLHIGMMTGAYISTVTAFVVVNYAVFSFINLPNWFFWFLPSAVLGPLIGYWTRKYTVKQGI